MTTHFGPHFVPLLYVPFTADLHLAFDILVSLYTQNTWNLPWARLQAEWYSWPSPILQTFFHESL